MTFPVYAKPCTPLRAAHDSGRRRASWIRQVVIHSAEATSARGVAQFFATTAQASTQLAVDDRTCYRCVPDLVIPWGAPGVNRSGLHVELCGFARWTRDEWLTHDKLLRRAAFKCGSWAWTYRIPMRWLSVPQVRGGTPGFLTHHDASQAFHTPGGHVDPGAGFPRDVFLGYVREYRALIEAERGKR